MLFDRSLSHVVALAVLAVTGIAAADAQTCDSLLGGVNCGASSRTSTVTNLSYDRQGSLGTSAQGLGFDLSGGSSRDDQPAMFGSITFGGSGARCSGLFRTRDCF